MVHVSEQPHSSLPLASQLPSQPDSMVLSCFCIHSETFYTYVSNNMHIFLSFSQCKRCYPTHSLLFLLFKVRNVPSGSLPTETHRTDSFPGASGSKAPACNAGDLGSIPGLGRSPGKGNGNPFQYSYLENPKDGGAQ